MLFILATNNPGKAREFKPAFDAAGLELISLADLCIDFEAGEDGDTFAHNATQKAQEVAAHIGEQLAQNSLIRLHVHNHDFAVLADDSGLVIDALDGAPGVDSALFMGRDTPYVQKCNAILDMLKDVPEDKRTARFICTLACKWPDGTVTLAESTVEGRIAHNMHGEGGFGYDPIFYYPPQGKTMAEMSQDEKNQVSHRGQAIQKMIGLIVNAGVDNQRLPRQE